MGHGDVEAGGELCLLADVAKDGDEEWRHRGSDLRAYDGGYCQGERHDP